MFEVEFGVGWRSNAGLMVSGIRDDDSRSRCIRFKEVLTNLELLPVDLGIRPLWRERHVEHNLRALGPIIVPPDLTSLV